MPKKLHVRAEKLKDEPGVENPWALAAWQLKQESRKSKARRKMRVKRPLRRGD